MLFYFFVELGQLLFGDSQIATAAEKLGSVLPIL